MNKALHLTGIPLRFIAEGELYRSAEEDDMKLNDIIDDLNESRAQREQYAVIALVRNHDAPADAELKYDEAPIVGVAANEEKQRFALLQWFEGFEGEFGEHDGVRS